MTWPPGTGEWVVDASSGRCRLLFFLLCLQSLFFIGGFFLLLRLSVGLQTYVEELSQRFSSSGLKAQLLDRLGSGYLPLEQYVNWLPGKFSCTSGGKLPCKNIPPPESLERQLGSQGYNALQWFQGRSLKKVFFDDGLVPEEVMVPREGELGKTGKTTTGVWFRRGKERLYQGISTPALGGGVLRAGRVIDLGPWTTLYAYSPVHFALISHDREQNQWQLLQNTLDAETSHYLDFYLKRKVDPLGSLEGWPRGPDFQLQLKDNLYRGRGLPIFVGAGETYYLLSLSQFSQVFEPLKKYRGGLVLIFIFSMSMTILLGFAFLGRAGGQEPESEFGRK